MSQLLSCSNCWFAPLQAGSVGLNIGYCVEHGFILRRPDETTCWRQTRKDLLLPSALAQRALHEDRFAKECPLRRVMDAESADNEIYRTLNLAVVNGDPISNVVIEYGEYGTKIESLAQLRMIPGPRAELALLSLGRGYTHRCLARGGRWTSGLHLLWWIRRNLDSAPVPEIRLEDLRHQLPVSIGRQVELVQWFLMMLRLIFISDVGHHAATEGDDMASLADLPEEAAAEMEMVSVRKLKAWVRNKAIPRIDAVLPRHRYRELSQELHRDLEAQAAGECR